MPARYAIPRRRSMTRRVKSGATVQAVLDLARHRRAAGAAAGSGRPGTGLQQGTRIMQEAQALADRYVAVWNEADAGRRRQAIADLWASDAQHYTPTRAVRGHAELEQRVVGSYERNVRDGGNRFRPVPDARALRDVVTFHWEMLPAGSERIAASGEIVLLLDAEGRIRTDYQFTF